MSEQLNPAEDLDARPFRRTFTAEYQDPQIMALLELLSESWCATRPVFVGWR